MKTLATINMLIMVLLLQGCMALTVANRLLPTPHDPALAQAYVTVRMRVSELSCEDKSLNWDQTRREAVWLDNYAKFRSDKQQDSTAAIVENLDKARNTQSVRACETWMRLVDQRLTVLNKAWSGR